LLKAELPIWDDPGVEMQKRSLALLLSAPFLVFIAATGFSQSKKKSITVIAHRGACGYLPEHSLAGTAMAHAWGVDFIEPDVVLTKDNKAIVLHDIHLDTTTNVAEKFPKLKREDGRYYAIDLTLAQVKTLQLHERVARLTGELVFDKRFPKNLSSFRVPTLVEQIELIQGLNKSTGREVGIYPELKHPSFHKKAGRDITKLVWQILTKYGYTKEGAKIVIQCFEAGPLKRLKSEFRCKVPLVQLIGANIWKESKIDYEKMRSAAGLADVAKYASGVGVWLGHVATEKDGKPTPTSLVEDAHKAGLIVHVYTARADQVPAAFDSFNQLIYFLERKAKVDGIFSDHADKVIIALKRR
jgi:glycerophosphoryl diester phosphodiesterase